MEYKKSNMYFFYEITKPIYRVWPTDSRRNTWSLGQGCRVFAFLRKCVTTKGRKKEIFDYKWKTHKFTQNTIRASCEFFSFYQNSPDDLVEEIFDIFCIPKMDIFICPKILDLIWWGSYCFHGRARISSWKSWILESDTLFELKLFLNESYYLENNSKWDQCNGMCRCLDPSRREKEHCYFFGLLCAII